MTTAVMELEKAMDVEIRDILIGSVMGKGAIPLYGRETRKEPCSCCLIDPAGPNTPKNRMCTTKGAIGLLNNREEREWCSEIKIVPDGRCARAMAIREAAKECKEKHPDDTEAFFSCYIPAFSQITRGDNPGIRKEPWQMTKDEFVSIYLERFKHMLTPRAFAEVTPEELQKEREEAIDYQKHTIKHALARGELVAPEVLADYPDLVK